MPCSTDGAARPFWISIRACTSLAPSMALRLDMVASNTEREAAMFRRTRRSMPSKAVLAKKTAKLTPDLAKSSGLTYMVCTPLGFWGFLAGFAAPHNDFILFIAQCLSTYFVQRNKIFTKPRMGNAMTNADPDQNS